MDEDVEIQRQPAPEAREQTRFEKEMRREEKRRQEKSLDPTRRRFLSLQQHCNDTTLKVWEVADTRAALQYLYLYTTPRPNESDWQATDVWIHVKELMRKRDDLQTHLHQSEGYDLWLLN